MGDRAQLLEVFPAGLIWSYERSAFACWLLLPLVQKRDMAEILASLSAVSPSSS